MNEENFELKNKKLFQHLSACLKKLEEKEELVICSENNRNVTKALCASVLEVTPRTDLTTSELIAVRLLILHAISDKSFFDWEMSTLTGLQASEFEEVAEKLPVE